MLTSATHETVQLCFGLLSTDKSPKTTLVSEVESTVKHIANYGTYVSSDKLVYDTYEKISGCEKLRAYIDFDVKRYVDGNDIPKYEGVILREQLRDKFSTILPDIESKYGKIVFGDSSGMKTPVGQYCVSFRIWFPCIVGSRLAVKAFADSLVNTLILPELQTINNSKINWEKFFDTSVYTSVSKLRLPGCTKQGEKYRPLTIDLELSTKGVVFSDALVSYINPKYDIQMLEDIVVEKSATKPAEKIAPVLTLKCHSVRKLTDSQYNLIIALGEVCSSSQWDDHNQRFSIISALWNAEQSERMCEFIHAQAEAKNSDNKPASIDKEIERSKTYRVHLNTLLKHAWNSDKDALRKVRSKYLYAWETLFKQSEEEGAIKEILRPELIGDIWDRLEYSDRYVRPYPLGEYDTIVVHSHMGTGKTVQLTGSKLHGIPGLLHPFFYPRILVLSSRRAYASFICGEFIKEGHTHFQNYLDVKGDLAGCNYLVLQMESLHRIADGYKSYDVVVMDESESLLAQMNSSHTHTMNHRRNYETLQKVVHDARKVIAMDAFLTNRTLDFLELLRPCTKNILITNTYQPYTRKATECVFFTASQILPSVKKMHAKILQKATCEKKRIVYICSSKEKGYEMEEALKKLDISVLFHCGDDTKDKKDLLLDVSKSWREYQVVIYTSTITVGVSYSDIPEDYEFDELFLYASAGCALPRDIAQALLRARKIKSNQLWFCIERRCIMPKTFGLKNVRDSVESRRECDAIKDLHWASTPEWVLQLISRNENEIAVSKRFYASVLREYLVMSGYEITEPIIDERVTDKTVRLCKKPFFDEIDTLDDDAALEIEKRMTDELATLEERIQFSKYKFIDLFLETTPIEFIGTVWDSFMADDQEAQFWNIVNERRRDLECAWRAETSYRYAEQARGALIQQSAIEKLCGVLGVENTCVEKVWSHDEFLKVVPAVLGMEDTLRSALGLRARRGAGKESDFNKAADLLKCALETWSGAKLAKVNGKQKRVEGKPTRFYDISIAPAVKDLWKAIK